MLELETVRSQGAEKLPIPNHHEYKTFRYGSQYGIIYRQRLQTFNLLEGLQINLGHDITRDCPRLYSRVVRYEIRGIRSETLYQ